VYLFVVSLHIVLCIFLVLIIILQPGKGGDIGSAFGGGGGTASVFGPRGPTNVLQHATTVVAVLFMGTSLTLALYSNRNMRSGVDVEEGIEQLMEEERSARGSDDVEAPLGEE